MLAALVAGAIAAIVAALVSLPLESPDDVFLNTASVTVGALVAAVAAGALWRILRNRPQRVTRFALVMGGALVAVVVLALIAESQLERMASFTIPLAAIVAVVLAAGVPALARLPLRPWAALAAIVPAAVLGLALAGRGDAESGRLELPAFSASTPASAPAGGGTATPAAAGGSAATPAAGGAREFRTPADVRGVTFNVGEGSEATFTVNEKLARLPLPSDAVVRTQAITGTIRLDGQPSVIRLDLQQLSSDSAQRDRFVRTQMFAQHPTAVFTVDSIGTLPAEYRQGEVVRRQVTGRLNVRGVERPLAFEVEARLDGRILRVLGRTTFKWADFDIPPPNIAGIVQVQDEVRVEVLLAAPAAG